MRFTYTLYDYAREKLESSGIAQRIEKAKKDYSIQIRGAVFESMIPGYVKDMVDSGYYKTMSKGSKQDFQARINGAYYHSTRHDHPWQVHRHDGVVTEPVEEEDLLMILGVEAAQILKPKEIWDFERFGFRNLTDFTGSVGALINEILHKFMQDRGYAWQTKTPDGRVLRNMVAGDDNFDMRVFQTDITPYKTIDPAGYEVSYRPQISQDREGIMAYHSTEAELFVICLKYADEMKLPLDSLKDNAEETIDWAHSLGQYGAGCAEHFGGFDRAPSQFFIDWNFPMQRLDPENNLMKADVQSFLAGVYSQDSYYVPYINNDNNLVFSHESRGNLHELKKSIQATYYPGDIDHLIKGLLYQCANGLGRTSCRQLIDILKYRFSEQMPKDLEELRSRIRTQK